MAEEMHKGEQNASFEKMLARLQEIVSTLELGDVSLDTGMKLYKEGMSCARQCRQIIKDAKHEISIWQDGEEMPYGQRVDVVRETESGL